MVPPGYFITGTDTGVGKTHVTAALASLARERGHRVFAWKPIETGCTPIADRLVGADQEAISSSWQQGPLRHAYTFSRPVAPLVAAQSSGTEIDLSYLSTLFLEGAASSSFTLVEGAGGWRVPITTTADMSTLASQLDLPILLVARGSLGTINHTLLSIEAILHDRRPLAAVVLSCLPSEDPSFVAENLHEIRRRFSSPLLALWNDPTILAPLLPPLPSVSRET